MTTFVLSLSTQTTFYLQVSFTQSFSFTSKHFFLHSHTNSLFDGCSGGNLGFSILPEDIWTRDQTISLIGRQPALLPEPQAPDEGYWRCCWVWYETVITLLDDIPGNTGTAERTVATKVHGCKNWTQRAQIYCHWEARHTSKRPAGGRQESTIRRAFFSSIQPKLLLSLD